MLYELAQSLKHMLQCLCFLFIYKQITPSLHLFDVYLANLFALGNLTTQLFSK